MIHRDGDTPYVYFATPFPLVRTRATVEAYRDLLAKVTASNPDMQNDLRDAAHMSRMYAVMAGVLRHAGRTDEAAALDARRLELWRQWERKLPRNAFVLRQVAMPSN